jgi:transcriptional regulator with XRE-family HTH domain
VVFPSEAKWFKRLKLVRVNKGQTQEDAAAIIGTTRKQIHLWETGKSVPEQSNRKKLAQWANVAEETLFKGL